MQLSAVSWSAKRRRYMIAQSLKKWPSHIFLGTTQPRTGLAFAPFGPPTCPLWVKKQTLALQKGMSALPPKADMCGALIHVRFGPIADMHPFEAPRVVTNT